MNTVKKLYMVELRTNIAVMATSAADAMTVAANNALGAVLDSGLNLGTTHPITSANQLHSGWDEDCIPYGWDGNTTIKDILLASEKGEADK